MPTTPITWEQIIEWGSISREAYEFLQSAIRARVNIVVAGGPGSGKTTVANRLAELIPPDERVIVVEAIYEMQVRHPRCLHLEAGGPANVSFGELVVKASCMRPDWLIVGELYGPEAMHALQVMSHGHTGLATVHADQRRGHAGPVGGDVLDGEPGSGPGRDSPPDRFRNYG